MKQMMSKRKFPTLAVIALVITAIALTVTTLGALIASQNLSSTGAITVSPNLSVYSDIACTNSTSSIDWGTTIAPGSTVTRTVYVKNTGTGTSLTLSMSPSDWTPAGASGYIALSWGQTGTRLAPGASTAAVFTMTVSSSIVDVTNFSVQILISGTSA